MESKTRASRATPAPRLLSIDDAGELMGVSSKTIRRLIRTGELRGYRFGKRMIRVEQSELLGLLRPIPSASDNPLGDPPWMR